ncbi:MAG: L-rhamnose isomerase, partial [Solobacterium sp.]|nr:L-rhamnose isomerase [Solobacterium sp.]
KEVIRWGVDRVKIALDYFDPSITRISSWATGYRNFEKALLFALLEPHDELKQLQDAQNFTKLMITLENLKTMPFSDIWDQYCLACNKPLDKDFYAYVEKYEKEVLMKRG